MGISVKCRIRISGRETSNEDVFFQSISPERSPIVRLPSLACSVALHVAVLVALPPAEIRSGYTERRVSVFLVDPLHVQMPDPLYYSPQLKKKVSTARRSGEATASATTDSQAELKLVMTPAALASMTPFLAKEITLPPPQRSDPKRFELPPLPAVQRDVQTLIQPDTPIRLEPVVSTRLPQVVVWAQPAPRKPEPKRFVMPGRREMSRAPAELEAAPTLLRTNNQPRVSDLALKGTLDCPRLPRYASGGSPVRLDRPFSAKPVDPFLGADRGDPLNLVSIPSEPTPWKDKVEVPPFMQAAGRPAISSSFTGNDAGSGSKSGGSGQAQNSEPGDNGNNTRQIRKTEVKGAEESSARSSVGSSSNSNDADTSAGPQNSQDGLRPVITRMLHPRNATFDLVIQSSASDLLPEAEGVLSGRPVYTAYLPVGRKKQWILQYCMPASKENSRNEEQSVVRLENATPLKAPYPLETYALVVTSAEGQSKYFLVHGFVSTQGSFESLAVIRGGKSEVNSTLLLSLQNWEFRPATRDGLPIRVEILLAIPVES